MMLKTKTIIFFLTLLCVQSIAIAQTDSDNNICVSEGFTFSNGALILNNDRPVSRVFQIQNIGGGTVTLNKESQDDPGMSAGWTSSIDGGQYTLLAMSQPNFSFRCMINNPPYEMGLANCQRVLNVCTIKTKQTFGSFWMSENKSLMETLQQLKSRRMVD